MNILSQIGGYGMVHSLLAVLVIVVCCLLIYAVGVWFIGKVAAPPIVRTCWDGFFVIVGLIIALNFLLGLTGRAFLVW